MERRMKGEGSIDFHNGSWRWRLSRKDPMTGKKETVELYGPDKPSLRIKIKQFKAEMNAGKLKDLTVKDWVQIWIEDLVSKSCKPKTAENYKVCTKNHILPCCGNLKLSQVTPLHLQNYFNALLLERSAVTVITVRRIFIVCFNAAITFGYLTVNPAKKTKPPKKPQSKTVALTDEEVKRLLDALEPKSEDPGSAYLEKCYQMAVKLALGTGMRQGEVFGLKWENIDIKTLKLSVKTTLSSARGSAKFETPKTIGSVRSIILPDALAAELKTWRAFQRRFEKKYNGIYINADRLVFTNSFGGPVGVSNFMHRCFAPALKEAGIEGANFHTLRHTHASKLLAAGVDIQIVSQRLGHSSVSTTLNIYKHLLPNLEEHARGVLNQIWN